jgi:hypothetical protein
VPEWLFDLRSPGDYLRRIKTVALSLPCVAGPRTAVHAYLALQHSQVRRSSSAAAAYPRSGEDAGRFADDFALAETAGHQRHGRGDGRLGTVAGRRPADARGGLRSAPRMHTTPIATAMN